MLTDHTPATLDVIDPLTNLTALRADFVAKRSAATAARESLHAAALAALAAGHYVTAVSTACGASRSTLYTWADAAGIEVRRPTERGGDRP